MISIENLTVSYDKKVRVLNNLNLILKDSQIHGIVGLNGAGKTTLLNTLYGLIKPDSGNIFLDGHSITKKQIGYLETENFFYSNITGEEYLKIFRNSNFNIEGWNDLFRLPLKELIETYSNGMKKKLALLAILKQDKPVMILDEPFNGLDIETTRIVRSILLSIKEHKIIIITSHIMETLTNLCDEISYLEQGVINSTKTKGEFDAFGKELYARIEEKNKEALERLLL
ncbi:MAG TPA: ATP-binding cassette domain-containing protein [Lentimicrobium sp.]|nr:ATP-binding cassette domain-containing protein [Lentimicrobium sp.]